MFSRFGKKKQWFFSLYFGIQAISPIDGLTAELQAKKTIVFSLTGKNTMNIFGLTFILYIRTPWLKFGVKIEEFEI